MRIAKRRKYDFNQYRAKKESGREFLEKHIDSSVVPLVMKVAEEMSLSYIDACVYYFSMFNSVQDLVNMHHNFTLPKTFVTTLSEKRYGAIRRRFVYDMRGYLKQPYLTNAGLVWRKINRLKALQMKELLPTKEELKAKEQKKKDKERAEKQRLDKLKKESKRRKWKARRRREKRNAVGLF